MSRVFPTGKCFCGCGEATEGTSYFVAGHDKRAEAKVVKECYGSVVELLAAHGYGPEGRDATAAIRVDTDRKGLQLLEKWSKADDGHLAHVVLEVLNMEERGGPRARLTGYFHPKLSRNDRAVRFERCRSEVPMELTVPFPDIAWVYVDRTPQSGRDNPERVVRLRGAVTSDPAPRFLSFG